MVRLSGSSNSAICWRSISPEIRPDLSANSAGASLRPRRLDSGTTTPIRNWRGRLMKAGVSPAARSRAGPIGSPMGSPSAARRCRRVPRNSPVSGSTSSTSSHSDCTLSASSACSSSALSESASSGSTSRRRPSSRSANTSARLCCSVRGSSEPRLLAAAASMPSIAATSAADTSPVT